MYRIKYINKVRIINEIGLGIWEFFSYLGFLRVFRRFYDFRFFIKFWIRY